MPPALQPQREIITLEQYESLPEHKRVEVFDGIAYDMASPSQIHLPRISLSKSYLQKIRQMIIYANCTITKNTAYANIGL